MVPIVPIVYYYYTKYFKSLKHYIDAYGNYDKRTRSCRMCDAYYENNNIILFKILSNIM